MSTAVGDEGGFAPSVENHEAAIQLILQAIENAGYTAGEQIALGLDCAASEFYKDGMYVLAGEGNMTLTATQWTDMLAGWCDKYAQVAGNANPVSGPYFNISVPEPTGVVAMVAPQDSALLGLVAVVAPALVTGNTVVVIASERFPLSAISLAEVLATSDVPGGVVNVLTGSAAEMAPWLASHADVNALDLAGAGDLEWIDLEIAAADTLKRVLSPVPDTASIDASPSRITAFVETKTVWHTKSMV